MPLNPLDWTAGPFLALYVALFVASIVIVRVMRSRVPPTGSTPLPVVADALELAWLTGGRKRAAETVLVAFLESGTAKYEGRKRSLSVKASPLPPPGFRRFSALTRHARTAAGFRRAIRSGLDTFRDELAPRGLVPSREAISRLTTRTLWIMAIPLVLGASKTFVGLERDRPVGFLVALLLATLVFTLYNLLMPPFRTALGRAAVDAARQRASRAARAPADGEMVLAFALSGAAVLAGRPYASLLQPSGGGSGDSGSGCSGGGGDSGSGGGGCGGCGGGGGGGSC